MRQTDQLFYIYDESGKKLGIKDRHCVHHEGDWHRGVQLNLCCDDLLLMQRRSQSVDIAKGLLDQSLATQLLIDDNEDDLQALKRGLMQELGVDINDLKINHLAGPVKIIKRYEYDASLYNREFVSLYQANIQYQVFKPSNPKVNSLFWMPIKKVKEMAAKNPENFTNTFLMWLKEVM